MQLLHNLYLVGGRHFYNARTQYADCNVFAVRAPEGILLVDCGYDADSLATIDANLAYWGMKPEDVRYVLLTHSHYDHVGNARTLQARGAKLVAHPSTAEALALGDERTVSYAFNRADFPTCQVDILLEPPHQVLELAGQTFEAVNVPGHTEGNTLFLTEMEGRKIMFTGDFAFHERAANPEETLAWNGGTEFDTGKFIDSLLRVRKMRVDVLLPGHYGFLLRDASAILDNALVVALRAWGNQYAGR